MSIRPRILVADDRPTLLADLVRLLEASCDAEVEVALDGGVALARLEEDAYDFDLLLLDVDMPRASGLDVLSAVRSTRPELPVVLLSGNPNHRALAQELGAQAFLEKPIRTEELAPLLDLLLVPDRTLATAAT